MAPTRRPTDDGDVFRPERRNKSRRGFGGGCRGSGGAIEPGRGAGLGRGGLQECGLADAGFTTIAGFSNRPFNVQDEVQLWITVPGG